MLGKDNLEEFAAGATSNNPHYGAVHNPWGLDHIPGGSSGGGRGQRGRRCHLRFFGATDLGGSVRLPGTFCGVVGLKQTFGRVSQRGLLVTSFNGDHIGPMTRSVSDSALVLQAIAGYDPLDPSTVPVPVPDYLEKLGQDLSGLKAGVPSNYFFDLLDPEVESSVWNAIFALQELGVEGPGSQPSKHGIRGGAAGGQFGRRGGDPRTLPDQRPGEVRPRRRQPDLGRAVRPRPGTTRKP